MENFNELNQFTKNKLPNITTLFKRFLYCWKNSFVYKGRANRAEFWGFVLFAFLLAIIPFVGWIYFVVAFFPFLAVLSRRVHDTGQSSLPVLIPLIIGIVGFGIGFQIAFLGIIVISAFCQEEYPVGALEDESMGILVCAIMTISPIIAVAVGIWTFILSVKAGTNGSNKYGDIPK